MRSHPEWPTCAARSLALACAIAVTTASCADVGQALRDTRETQAAVKSELGVDAAVSVRTFNGHTTVGVRLESTPPGEAAAIKAKVTEIVKAKFHGNVERVDVAL